MAATSVEHIIAKSDLLQSGVLLEIWDIADTANAFYQAIDYLYNEGDVSSVTDAPSTDAPTTESPPPPSSNDDQCYDRHTLLSTGYARSICDCHKFYQSVNNESVLMECQNSLVFDPSKNECNWRDKVDVSGIQNCS